MGPLSETRLRNKWIKHNTNYDDEPERKKKKKLICLGEMENHINPHNVNDGRLPLD